MTETNVSAAAGSTETSNQTNQTTQQTTNNSANNIFDVSRYFSEDLRKDPDFERLSKNIPNDPEKLVKDLYHKTKYFGRAKEEVRKELETELNKPQVFDPTSYTYQMPENYQIEDKLQEVAKSKALELGIKPEQFKGMMEAIFETDNQIDAALKAEQKRIDEEAINTLKAEWGNDFDKKAANIDRTWQYFTNPEDDKIFDSLDGQSKVVIYKLVDKISQKISEPQIGKTSLNSSRADIQSEINRIMSDKSHPYWRGDKGATEQMIELYKRLGR